MIVPERIRPERSKKVLRRIGSDDPDRVASRLQIQQKIPRRRKTDLAFFRLSSCAVQLCLPTLLVNTFIVFSFWASLITQLVKNPPAMQETLVRFLGQEDTLEKG